MIEHHIDIPTADGAMNTFVACASWTRKAMPMVAVLARSATA
jgi:hypothetical protein